MRTYFSLNNHLRQLKVFNVFFFLLPVHFSSLFFPRSKTSYCSTLYLFFYFTPSSYLTLLTLYIKNNSFFFPHFQLDHQTRFFLNNSFALVIKIRTPWFFFHFFIFFFYIQTHKIEPNINIRIFFFASENKEEKKQLKHETKPTFIFLFFPSFFF